MDREMPEMSGSETVQEIRRLQREKEAASAKDDGNWLYST